MDFNRLEQRRKILGLTQKQVAEKAGMHVNTYSRILRDKTTTVETLENLSKALETAMNFWWDDEANYAIDNTKLYGKMANEIIKDLMDDKKRLKAQIDDLENRLNVYESKKKEASSG